MDGVNIKLWSEGIWQDFFQQTLCDAAMDNVIRAKCDPLTLYREITCDAGAVDHEVARNWNTNQLPTVFQRPSAISAHVRVADADVTGKLVRAVRPTGTGKIAW